MLPKFSQNLVLRQSQNRKKKKNPLQIINKFLTNALSTIFIDFTLIKVHIEKMGTKLITGSYQTHERNQFICSRFR